MPPEAPTSTKATQSRTTVGTGSGRHVSGLIRQQSFLPVTLDLLLREVATAELRMWSFRQGIRSSDLPRTETLKLADDTTALVSLRDIACTVLEFEARERQLSTVCLFALSQWQATLCIKYRELLVPGRVRLSRPEHQIREVIAVRTYKSRAAPELQTARRGALLSAANDPLATSCPSDAVETPSCPVKAELAKNM